MREKFEASWIAPCSGIAWSGGRKISITASSVMPPAMPTIADRIAVKNAVTQRIASVRLRECRRLQRSGCLRGQRADVTDVGPDQPAALALLVDVREPARDALDRAGAREIAALAAAARTSPRSTRTGPRGRCSAAPTCSRSTRS